jgi:UDP-2,3-diacylglucosamine pyrophosphatase LpxH
MLTEIVERGLVPKGSTIFHVGDINLIGISKGTLRAWLQDVNKIITPAGIYLKIIRGNHDNPYFFNEAQREGNVMLLPDYTELRIQNTNIVAIGGGVSLNYEYLTPGYSWYPDLELTRPVTPGFRLKKKAQIVIAHCLPKVVEHMVDTKLKMTGAQTELIQKMLKDPYVIGQIETNAQRLNSALDYWNPDIWIAGHYHTDFYTKHNNTHFRVVDRESLTEITSPSIIIKP